MTEILFARQSDMLTAQANITRLQGQVATLDLTTINVFLIAGQSNALGQGDNLSKSPTVPHGKVLQVNSGVISDANDPVGTGSTGSAWPAFGLAIYEATNQLVAFVPAAVGGTGQFAISGDGGSNWDTTGTLVTTAIATLNSAIGTLVNAGYNPIFRGVLWSQGEHDAAQINASTETQSNYSTALGNMVPRFRSANINGATYPQMPFYMFKTGTDTSKSDSGFSQVRAAQETYVNGDAYAFMVWRNAYDYVALSYMQGSPPDHYTQVGYNLMGQSGARGVLASMSQLPWQYAGAGSANIYYTQGTVSIGWPSPSASTVLLTINGSGAAPPSPLNSSVVVQEIANASSGTIHEIDGYGSASIFLARTALGTASAPTKVTNNTLIAQYAATGYDASPSWGLKGHAAINMYAAEDWVDASHHGTYVKIRTTPTASDTPADAVVVSSAGLITFSNYGAGAIVSSSAGLLSSSTFGGDATLNASNQLVLAAVNVLGAGTWGDSTHSAQITLNGKGLATAATSVVINPTQVNSVAFPSGPSTNTIPVVTSSNTITYETAPPAAGGTGLSSPTAHSILQSEGASNFSLLTAATAGNIIVDQGAGSDWSSVAVSGDVTLASNGAITIGNNKVTNAKLANSAITIGSTSISLGATSASLLGTIGFGTESNPQTTWVFSANTTTGIAAPATVNFMQVGANSTAFTVANLGFAAGGSLTFARADGTAASPTTLTANDVIGGTGFGGWNGASSAWVINKARIVGFAIDTYTNSAQGTGIEFDTTPASSTTRTQAGRFMAGFIVGTSTTDPGAGNISMSGGIVGITGATNAASGIVGEYISSQIASGSAVSLTTATATDVTTISLTAGDWDVRAMLMYTAGATTVTSKLEGWINTSANTNPGGPNSGGYAIDQGISITGNTIPSLNGIRMRINVSSTTTVSLGTQAAFTTSTLTAYGFIGARRIR